MSHLTGATRKLNVWGRLSRQPTSRIAAVCLARKLGRKLHEAMTAATGAGAALTAEEANGTILVLKQYKIAEMAAPGVVAPLGAKTALLSTLLKSLPDVPRNFAELEQVLDAIRNVTV